MLRRLLIAAAMPLVKLICRLAWPSAYLRGRHFEASRIGWKWAWQEYYAYRNILKRFQWEYKPTLANKLVYFPFNLVQHRFVQKKILRGQRLGWSKVPWAGNR